MIKYNGFEFPPESNLSIVINYEYDDAGRMIVAQKWVISVRATILPKYYAGEGTTAALHMEEIRQKLGTPGQELILEDVGIEQAALEVNKVGGGGTYDIKWGPRPIACQWTPIGADKAGEILWTCETNISPCSDWNNATGVSEIAFKVTYRIDRKGFTTRTISGYIRVAQTFAGGASTTSADGYRGLIAINRIDNAHREWNWDLSLDKSRIDFACVDQEIESPTGYPGGVINIKTRNRLTSRRPWNTASNEIRTEITLAQNQPRTRAWYIFTQIVNHYLTPIQAYTDASGNDATAFYEALDIEEGMFDNEFTFTLRWRWVGGLDELLSTNFMFQNGPASFQWSDWSATMANVQDHRGLAQQGFNYQHDVFGNLCNVAGIFIPSDPAPTIPPPDTLPSLCNAAPDPNKSYLRFKAFLTEVTDMARDVHRTLVETPVNRVNFDLNETTAKNLDYDTSSYDQIESAGPIDTQWEWKGAAVRVGYPVPRPDQLTIGGKDAVPIGKQIFEQQYMGKIFCQPVYAAAWKMRFAVKEKPADDAVDQTKLGLEFGT